MNLYSGLFLLALSTLAFEIALSRLLSVITFYHLSFFAVSAAMLGLAAGGLSVYLRDEKFDARTLAASAARSSLLFALSIPICVTLLCLIYLLTFDNWRSAMTWFGLLALTGLCVAPFYYSGQGIACVLTRSDKPIGRLYASDLFGAALGCLLVLCGLEYLDAPGFMLVCGALAGLAAVLFSGFDKSASGFKSGLVCFVVLLLAGFASSASPWGIRPLYVKGNIEIPGYHEIEKWSASARTGISHIKNEPPYYWGASTNAPQQNVDQRFIEIDGMAGSPMYRMNKRMDVVFLGYDVTNVGYFLRRNASACIIGVGGGRDLQSALLFGHHRVVGVDVNPVFKRWHENEFRDFSGIGANPEVELVSDEGRSYLSRSNEKFSIIQMSVVDTWAASAAGAFSLSENALYTQEAWRLFYQHLSEDGILSVARWHSREELGETGRIATLAMSTLMAEGVADPRRHLAIFSTDHVSTTLMSRNPFTEKDLAKMREVAGTVGFYLTLVPDATPALPLLEDIVKSRTPAELKAAIADVPFNLAPPTDDNPYFFNMLKLNRLDYAMSKAGVINGNLMATLTLLGLIVCLGFFCLVTIVFPAFTTSRRSSELPAPLGLRLAGPLYFSLIGIGFMLTEMGLLQRLSLLLGHPVYALSVLLFGLILSTSIGSWCSEVLPIRRLLLIVLPLLTCVSLFLLASFLSPIVTAWITSSLKLRVLVSLALVAPTGLLLGFYFPIGMRIFGQRLPAQTPWYWALNGCFGVLSTAIAVLISIYAGISVNFYLAALCYAGILLALYMAGVLRQVKA